MRSRCRKVDAKWQTPKEEEIVYLGNSLTALRSLAEGATPINLKTAVGTFLMG